MKSNGYRIAVLILFFLIFAASAVLCALSANDGRPAAPVAALSQSSDAQNSATRSPQLSRPNETGRQPRRLTSLAARAMTGSGFAQPLKLDAEATEDGILVAVTNAQDEPVKGVPFVVLLDGETEYPDEDRDGSIAIGPLEQGAYTIALKPAEGYALPEPVTVTVSGPVDYTPVENIQDKIVDANKIDPSQEDAGYGHTEQPTVTPAPPEPEPAPAPERPPADTVQYVASYVDVKTSAEEVPVTDEQGRQVVRYLPAMGPDGCLLLTGGESSGLVPYTDEEGYLLGALDGENSAVPVFDETGTPLADESGQTLYQMTAVPQFTTEVHTTYVYYGWQTLEGKTYYFDNNVPVTGVQVIQSKVYLFDADGVLQGEQTNSGTGGGNTGGTNGKQLGIDVSSYQGNIDWAQVKNAGVEFVMIRVGFRGYGSGVLVEDSRFRQYAAGATAAGLKVGVYFFSQAVTPLEAVEEASMVLELIRGYNIRYPVAFDTEYVGNGARADKLSASQRTQIAVAFCETIRNAGYTPMVYASKSWLLNNLHLSQLSNYKIWLAHYTTQTDYPYRYDIWQYTGSGKIPGISVAVDINYGYMGY